MEAKYAGPVATGLDTSQKREKTAATCWYNFNGDFIINLCKEEGREGGRADGLVSSGQTYEDNCLARREREQLLSPEYNGDKPRGQR